MIKKIFLLCVIFVGHCNAMDKLKEGITKSDTLSVACSLLQNGSNLNNDKLTQLLQESKDNSKKVATRNLFFVNLVNSITFIAGPGFIFCYNMLDALYADDPLAAHAAYKKTIVNTAAATALWYSNYIAINSYYNSRVKRDDDIQKLLDVALDQCKQREAELRKSRLLEKII